MDRKASIEVKNVSSAIKCQSCNISSLCLPFSLNDESLNEQFLIQAKAAGLLALEGHRIVGGMRASIYNAMPLAGVQALVDFMAKFAQENS
mgnify:CR=1 FL=1